MVEYTWEDFDEFVIEIWENEGRAPRQEEIDYFIDNLKEGEM